MVTIPGAMYENTYPQSPVTDRLSPRELEVLEMTAQGLTNSQVGGNLNLSLHAVKFHLASIYRKLGVSNRTEAAVVYLRSQSQVNTEAAAHAD
jgi:two-component system nitrate/nitrite response regulator NarL